jgi:AcrR family transcriptional regulator
MTHKLPREERLLQILDAASEIFIGKGYENASMDDVARAAGLSKGALYHHYAAKSDLLSEVGERLMKPVFLLFAEAREAADPIDGILSLAGGVLNHWSRRPREYALVLQYFSSAFTSPAYWPGYRRHHAYRAEVVRSLYARAIAGGALRSFDTDPVAVTFLSFLDGYTGYFIMECHQPAQILTYIRKAFIDPYLQSGREP